MLSDSVKRILTHTEYSYIQHETNHQNDKKEMQFGKTRYYILLKRTHNDILTQ